MGRDVVDLLVADPNDATVVQRVEILLAGAQHWRLSQTFAAPRSTVCGDLLVEPSLCPNRQFDYKLQDMRTIPGDYASEPDLHHLRVLDVLLREHSLTRAARELNVTQPALSKTLARLRRYFDDPLFVRVALRMEPTPKALRLQSLVARDPRPRARRCAANMLRSIRAPRAAPSTSASSTPG